VLADAVEQAARVPLATTPHERARLPRPKPPNRPPPAWQLARPDGELDGVRGAIARLALEHDRTSASVRALERTAHDRGAGEVVERLGAERTQAPRVSVLLTVADEAASVGRAIELLAVSAFTDHELVVIDDGSRDGSGNRVRAGLARAPWLSATLLTRADRGGIAQARNAAVERAVGDLVLVMDARDAPYPHGLGRLVAALERDPSASFAYGIVERDDVTGPCGLAGHLGWDPDVLRYGDFVSTMTLVRRRALLEAGGYETDPRLAGWENLALWCAFADRGWSGAHAPEIVGRRRVGLAAPSGPTVVDPSTAWSVLLERFACLSSNVAA
jgi:hypothetical protein